ncbi:MAG: hypothetical protein F6K55_25995 [Moorea sp. SIO4A3]|nr:hypothetical protein [Moorena sp. SIO4A3]
MFKTYPCESPQTPHTPHTPHTSHTLLPIPDSRLPIPQRPLHSFYPKKNKITKEKTAIIMSRISLTSHFHH